MKTLDYLFLNYLIYQGLLMGSYFDFYVCASVTLWNVQDTFIVQ